MPDTFWLEAGEDNSDRLDLMSGHGALHGITVVASGGFDIVPDASNDDYQIVTIPLVFRGTSKNQLLGYRRQVLAKLEQARAGSQPGAMLPMVNVGIRLEGATEMVRWFVESGELTRGSLVALPSNVLGSASESADLILRCYTGGVGEVIEYGPFTVTGAGMTLHIDGIPGDMPAVAEMVVDDNTTGAAVNRIRWAARSLPDLDDGDLPAIVPFDTGGSDADAVDGTPVIHSTSTSWQTAASVTQDADYGGVVDVFARLSDSTAFLGTPGSPDLNWSQGVDMRQYRHMTPSSLTSPTTVAFQNGPSLAGSLLVLLGTDQDGGTITTPTNFTQVFTENHSSGDGPRFSMFYRENAPETDSVIVTHSGGWVHFILMEFTGIKASGSLDVESSAVTATTANSRASGNTGTLAQAYSLAVAGVAISRDSTNYTASPITGTAVDSNIGSGHIPTMRSSLQASYGITTSTAAQNATGSLGGVATARIATGIAVFTAAAATVSSVPAGNYSICVAAVDTNGKQSEASNIATIDTIASGAISIEWEASTGPVDKYRVFLRKGSDPWMYFDTANATPALTITDLASKDGDGDPPLASEIVGGDFRFFFGRENSVMQQPPIGPFRVTLGSDVWEWVYIRRMHLPPSSSPLVGTPTGWSAVVQGRAVAPTNLGVDALALLPADEGNSGEAWYVPNNLTTPAVWRVWSTIHGYSNGYLSDGSDETGNLRVRGRLALGPGDTTMVLLPTVAGNVSKIENVSMKVTIWARPRYYWLAGAP